MHYISSRDSLSIQSVSPLSDLDFDVIVRLYQPIIGCLACNLYLTFSNFSNFAFFKNHEEFLNYIQLNNHDFDEARSKLEGVGLLKTYVKTFDDNNSYLYVIYPPKNSNDFFNDILFAGLLIRYIGKTKFQELAKKYEINIDTNNYQNVSSSFTEIFHPDLDNSDIDELLPKNIISHRPIIVDTNFSLGRFFELLKNNCNLNEKAFSKIEIKSIEKVATLFGLNELCMSDLVASSYHSELERGNRLDIKSLNSLAADTAKYSGIAFKNDNDKKIIKISGRTKLADEVELMSHLSPKEYLRTLQDGAPPVSSDLNLISYLSLNLGLSNGVINALIHFALLNCNNMLDRNYVEKIGASLKRSKITTAIDALNYFESNNKKKNKTQSESDDLSKGKINDIEKNKSESFDEDRYQNLLKRLNAGEKDGK